MEKDVLTNTYEELKASLYPVHVWGNGALARKVYRRLSEQGIEAAGFFVDAGYSHPDVSDEGLPVYSLDELRKKNDRIDVVIGHGHYEKRDEINGLSFIHKVYIIANPYLQYCSTGITEWIERNREKYDGIMERLADDESRHALHAYCRVNETNDIEYLMQDEFIVNHVFDFEGLKLTESERYLDVGAWIGDTVALFQKRTGNSYSHIYAVEPDPNTVERLKENLAGEKNISVYACGLGDKSGEFYLDVDAESDQSNSVSEEKNQEGQMCVPVRTIDELFDKEHLTLIKIFVPFIFQEVLQGGKKCILRDKPRLIVNIAVEAGTGFFDTIQWILDLDVDYQVALRFDMAMPTRLTLYAY